jgi:hypothetical protein
LKLSTLSFIIKGLAVVVLSVVWVNTDAQLCENYAPPGYSGSQNMAAQAMVTGGDQTCSV